MKVDAKEIKKLSELLAKENAYLVHINPSMHENYLSVKFTDNSGHEVEVKIYQADSQCFSKITREQRF